jgi:hypothetical protein
MPTTAVSVLSRELRCGRAVLAALFITGSAFGPSAYASMVDVTAPTTSWTPILYGSNNPDPSNDQQTGSSEGDIVGNAVHPSVYTMFGDAGTPSTTDGDLAFRIRLGADVNPAGFKTAVFVGVDANRDGSLDLFIGVNNSGAADTIGIWNPGPGLNISPNTTTIVSTPLVTYAQTATNYNWSAVSLTNDPTVGTATDLDGGGQNDHFLSFSVAFSDVVTQLTARGITGFDQNTPLAYVIATATQANSLNQDLNGVGNTYDGNATWSTLGVLSDGMTPAGTLVPEASSVLCGIAPLLLALAHDYFRRKKHRRSSSSLS